MKHLRRTFLRIVAGAAALPAVSRIAWAQAYPSRTVRVIAPFAPGGPVDVCARIIAQALSERLGKQFYVENIGGAAGNICTAQAAKAAPDGYTILIAVNSHVINPAMYDSIPYDPFKDFDPVILAVGFGTALAVHPSVSAMTVRELVDLVRSSPGKYSFASPGTGTPSHLLGEQFRLSLGLDLVHVPYNGSGPAITAVVGDHTPIAFAALSAAAPQARDGKLRVLAVMSKTRSEALPDVPTIAEAGYPDLDGDGWVGVLVPARTPQETIGLLHREITEVIEQPETRARLLALGFEPIGAGPEEFAAQMRRETEKWSKIIRAANIRAQ